MKTLHLLGHTPNWNLDAHFKNGVGDGFIFTAYSFPDGYFEREKISSYNLQNILQNSFFDLQYFSIKNPTDIGKLNTYDFHPINIAENDTTNIALLNAIKDGIQYQINYGFKNIIIPNYYENDNVNSLIGIMKEINNYVGTLDDENLKFYMSLPISRDTILDENKIETLLFSITDKDILFDGYYIMCEARTETMHKVPIDYKYLRNLTRVFKVLKSQKFTTIYAYSNWDSIIFYSAADIDYITIGTYETLRKFSIQRFIQRESGGPSKGWYFSEKLLNFIKSQELVLIRQQGGLAEIKNTKNIFSDTILNSHYEWSNNKPDVHKNYLLSIEKLLHYLSEFDVADRKSKMIRLINRAISGYNDLESKNIYLPSGSDNYHLETWKSHLSRL